MSFGFAEVFSNLFKTGMYNYCNIETGDLESDHILVNKDGSFTSYFEILGSYHLITGSSFDWHVEDIVRSIKSELRKEGYRLEFVFTRTPGESRHEVKKALADMRKTAEHLELQYDSILDEREQILSHKTIAERCVLVVTTTPVVLNPSELKSDQKKKQKVAEKVNLSQKPGKFAQSPFFASDLIRNKHIAIVKKMEAEFTHHTNLNLLDKHEALYYLRREIEPNTTPQNFKPNLLGDNIKLRLGNETNSVTDVSHLLNHDLSYQLHSITPHINKEDSSIVTIGTNHYAPLLVDIQPEEPLMFQELFNSIEPEISWRISIAITSGHDKIRNRVSNKYQLANFFSFMAHNKAIKNSIRELLDVYVDNDSEVLVGMQITACTWSDNLNKLRSSKETLSRHIQSWGNMGVIDERGDAIEAWTNTLPGYSGKLIANVLPETLTRVVDMLPFSRPVSAWNSGSVLFRTVDQRLYPYLPGSSQQTAWSDLYFAPPGYGKSFLLAAMNNALLMRKGNNILPRLSIIDIGFSSAAFCDLIRSSLPISKQHLVQSYRVKMTDEFCINVFDLPLGCTMPLAIDREALVNLMEMILIPAGNKKNILRLSEISGALVDAMYDYFHPDNNPNIYSRGISKKVDNALDLLSVYPGDGVTWYQITHKLFKENYIKEAIIAQRYAVPTLNDATTVLSSNSEIKDLFGDALFEGQSLIDFISSMLTSAVRDYKILSKPSQFDLGDARIVSFDLNDVAQKGSDRADKQTSIMYSLSRFALCREFYRDEDSLSEIPTEYRPYHKTILDKEVGVPKKIALDEFHRTESSPQIRAQIKNDIRVGRKYNVHIALLSQLLGDFDDDMVALANNIYILSKGQDQKTTDDIIARFKPQKDASDEMIKYVRGPSSEGSVMLYIGNLKGEKGGGRIEQVLRLTLGPQEIWSYSTTHEDVTLRRLLAKQIGLNNCLKILALEFPGGTAKSYLETLGLDDGEDAMDLYNKVINELIDKHKSVINPYD